MKQSIFPYKPRKRVKSMLKPVTIKDGGDEGNIDKNAWISDGPVKSFEMGLPIYGTIPPALDPNQPSPMDNMVNLLVNRPYAKDFNKIYHNLASKYPEFDIYDPDTRSYAEKQFIMQNSKEPTDLSDENELKFKLPVSTRPTCRSSMEAGKTVIKKSRRDRDKQKYTTVIPPDAYLQTFGGAIPYFQSQIFEDDYNPDDDKKDDQDKRTTGITGDRTSVAGNQSSLIREVHYSTLTKEEVEAAKSDDSPFRPIDIGRPTHVTESELSKMPKSDDTCEQCIKKYFDPTVGKPFVPKDAERDFPMDMFVGERKRIAPRNSILQSEIVSSAIDASNVPPPVDPQTTLMETKSQDILFTKDDTPLTRNDIAEMRAFRRHWDRLTEEQQENGRRLMERRQKMIKETFQSQKVFENYLKLLDEDCERIESGLLGKSRFKKQSIWEVAVKTAKYDPTALKPRRELWWRLGAFCKSLGGCLEPLEEQFILTVRKLLMERHSVDKSLFWDTLQRIPTNVLENIQSLTMIEFFRIALNIDQIEFDTYLIKRGASREIYIQTIVNSSSREVNEKMNAFAKGPIEVPEPD